MLRHTARLRIPPFVRDVDACRRGRCIECDTRDLEMRTGAGTSCPFRHTHLGGRHRQARNAKRIRGLSAGGIEAETVERSGTGYQDKAVTVHGKRSGAFCARAVGKPLIPERDRLERREQGRRLRRRRSRRCGRSHHAQRDQRDRQRRERHGPE